MSHLLRCSRTGTDIRTVKDLLWHNGVSITLIYTHVFKVGGTASPLDALATP